MRLFFAIALTCIDDLHLLLALRGVAAMADWYIALFNQTHALSLAAMLLALHFLLNQARVLSMATVLLVLHPGCLCMVG